MGAETLALHFFATEIGHKNVQILLKLAETLAYGLHVFMKEILQERRAWSFFERQYLEKDGINEKINIRFLQRIIFFVVL